MAAALTRLGTAEIASAERPRFWSDSLATLCGPLQTDCFGAKTIDGRIDYGVIGRLTLCRIEATRHRLALPPGDDRNSAMVKVILQIGGHVLFEQGGQRLDIGPGMAIAYDLARPHCLTIPSRIRHLAVIVPRDLAVRHGFTGEARAFSTRTGVGRLAFDLVNSTFRQLPSIARGCQGELAQTILQLLFLPLPENAPAAPGRELSQQIKSYIDANLHDPDLTIERIAAALNCSKRYLHMAFAGEGTTIARHIWMVRLDHCRRDLETARHATITDIAFSWGFNSSSHFSRLFKERYGFSPSRLLQDRQAG